MVGYESMLIGEVANLLGMGVILSNNRPNTRRNPISRIIGN